MALNQFADYLHPMKLIVLAFMLAVTPFFGFGQNEKDELYASISSLYFDSLGIDRTPIYAGEIDPLVVQSRTSTPYFKSRSWLKGSIYYDQSLYYDISFIYNISNQKLILKQADPTKRGGLVVDLEKVEWFSLADDYFRRSPFDKARRFFQLLYEGENFNLIAHRRKGTEASAAGVDFTDKTEYFVEYGNSLNPLRSKGDLKQIFSNYKEADQKVRSQNSKLKYSKFKEGLLINYMKSLDEKL